MNYDWFKIFSEPEFTATGLISRTFTATLGSYGEKDILITKGNLLSILYEGVFLPVEFNDENPYVTDGLAVYKDADDQVWLGIEVPE